jgi:hypothetical protein
MITIEEYNCKQVLFFQSLYGAEKLETNIHLFQRLAKIYRLHSIIIVKHVSLLKHIIFKGVEK